MGGDGYPCFKYDLSVGGTSGAIFWIRVAGRVRGDGENGGGNKSGITPPDERKDNAENQKQDVGDTSGSRGIEVSWGVDISYIHGTQVGDSGAVGEYMSNL